MARYIAYRISYVCLLFLFVVPHVAAQDKGEAVYPTAPTDVRPLLVGTHIPEVSLKTATGQPFDLAVAVAGKPAVLVFYRGWW